MQYATTEATSLLEALSPRGGDSNQELFTVLYRELHSLAHSAMRREGPGHILQTTALIHETYMRLAKSSDGRWRNREHFYRVAARAMRRILVSEARSRRAVKRGGGRRPVSLDELGEVGRVSGRFEDRFADLEELDKALDKLGKQNGAERICRVVELRFFAGLTHKETADVLKVSRATVRQDWEFAKVWLFEEMKENRFNAA